MENIKEQIKGKMRKRNRKEREEKGTKEMKSEGKTKKE